MRIQRRSTVPLLLCFSLLGCASKPEVDYDESYDFNAVTQVAVIEPKHNNLPLMAKRAQSAIEAQLLALNWNKSDNTPVQLQTTLWQQQQANDSQFSIGIGGGTSSSNTSIGGGLSIPVGGGDIKAQYIRLDLFDSGVQRWRAQTFFAVDDLTPTQLQQQMNIAVEKLIKQLPLTK